LDVRIRPPVDPLTTILSQDEAATSVEYAIMLALVILTALAAIQSFGTEAGTLWGMIRNTLQAVGFY
jgi:Flp pilus assembly pilin Flp